MRAFERDERAMADLYTRFVSRLLFPLHERLKGHDSFERLKAMQGSQWWSRAELEAHRLKQLRALLIDAGAHVPYYRQVFREVGFSPQSVGGLSDLTRLPLLSKPLIRANADKIRSEIAGPLKRYNTGGSSGEPLVFLVGKDRISHDVAAKWRATQWWGVDIGDPEIVVWGSPIELDAQDRLKAVRDRVLRTRLLPAFEMSEATLSGFVGEIRRVRPRMVFGYPSALAHIARYAEDHGQRLDNVDVRVVFVTSERLYDHQRQQIERVFGCPLANGYGGRDAGFIAHECPAGRMHLSAEDVIVEIVDLRGTPASLGERGEIVVTHLATRDFPFIRYRTGDIGALDDGPCSCGRGLPLLREIEGRSTDFIVARDGTVMHGLALIYVMRDLPGIERFKIVQESLGHTRVLVVCPTGLSFDVRERIVAGFRARLGAEVNVEIDEVSEIPLEKSGKFRYVLSKVAESDWTR